MTSFFDKIVFSRNKCKVLLIKGVRKHQLCGKECETSEMCVFHELEESKRPYNPYVDFEVDYKN